MYSHMILAVKDAIHEAKILGTVDLSAAMRFIPEEFHVAAGNAEGRFIASVIANAQVVRRSPYTVAAYALDI